jgi:hypothetical protein
MGKTRVLVRNCVVNHYIYVLFLGLLLLLLFFFLLLGLLLLGLLLLLLDVAKLDHNYNPFAN